jgi:effector-binding domain-containing protein
MRHDRLMEATIEGPTVIERAERQCAGIRVVTPFRGMYAVRDRLLKELYAWLDERGQAAGVTFFRLHVVDMAGDMDVELGVVTDAPVEGDDRVRAGVLPAGRYATLIGAGNGLAANRTLNRWIEEQGRPVDVTAGPGGDHFGCRYEAYLTDPRSEPRKTRWRIELATRLA